MFLLQGYNAARDRLWQIDLWRKRGLGLLAKDFGPDYVAQDRATRFFRRDLTTFPNAGSPGIAHARVGRNTAGARFKNGHLEESALYRQDAGQDAPASAHALISSPNCFWVPGAGMRPAPGFQPHPRKRPLWIAGDAGRIEIGIVMAGRAH
jgi:Penicillin amidase